MYRRQRQVRGGKGGKTEGKPPNTHSCPLLSHSYYTRLVTTTLVPLALGGVVFAWAFLRDRHNLKLRARALLVVTLIVYLVLPAASTVIFRTFDCERFDDGAEGPSGNRNGGD